MKTAGTNPTTVYVAVSLCEAQGNLTAEYGGSNSASGTQYLTTDHLGSTRLVTDQSGSVAKTFDYLPFGEEIGGTSSTGPTQRFTGQERDTESGIDFFKARYASAPQGRFQSPDPAGMFVADPSNPQSWNLYAYALNNPLKYIDPTGMTCVTTEVQNDDGTTSTSIADNGDSSGCADAGVAPDSAGPNQITPQTVTVSAQPGSSWDYLWVTTFNQIPLYVPNDVPLSTGARQVLQQVYKSTWVIAQPLCSGGAFGFAGGGLSLGKFHLEGYFLPFEFESGKGLSTGGIIEAGISNTPFSFGGEFSYNWTSGQWSGEGIAFANKDIGGLKLGPVSVGALADTSGNVGGYAGGVVGAGAYGRPSFISGCRSK